ncbi:protein mono-ADP-ribosyltransferase PARP3-like [Rhopilema esculentum]|uniref:protein mono-ADP-ribosyltransferase PARP3-like n=1 Tax=Rhopilema esculentum TaxID=499914 RepID=UPI0031DED656
MPPKKKAQQKQDGTELDLSKLKVEELRTLCKKRGLQTTGRKTDLVDRLQKSDEDAAAGGKKIKLEEEEDEKPTVKDKLVALAAEEKKKKKQCQRSVDSICHLSNAAVFEDYDCMLNQTNIGQNNNKFYVIQLLQSSKAYYVWNRWGRVGEPGSSALKGPFGFEAAKKEFEKKFKDKTRNDWAARDDFQPVKGKYTLIEMDASDETDNAVMEGKLSALDAPDGAEKKFKPCKLDKATQDLLSLLFDSDMFKEAMTEMNLDVKKMPLGKLSKMQIAKGFGVLEEIEKILDQGKKAGLEELTSRFFTVIPHSFGRQRPPVINTKEILQKKMDMLTVLGDIEIAQRLKQEEEESQAGLEMADHPIDVNYSLLSADLELVKKDSEEFKYISTYTNATKISGYRSNLKILDVWRMNRHSEGERFKEHDELKHRKLLWHGTNIAVVVAILKSGLRIMPHSGGRVGRGIYFASENGKSSGYVGISSKNIGIMFLCEVALGKEKEITADDSSLKAAPKGYDSIVARGRTEPDPKHDVKVNFDGKEVIVPQGKPINQKEFAGSHFSQSEYLVYKESQVRMRYLLEFQF